MFRISKSVLALGASGAGALALGVLILAAPRAARAVAATLVQVTNTSADPAATQDVGSQASQLVSLYSSLGLGDRIGITNYFGFVLPGPVTQPVYSVPPSQSLVITDIDTVGDNCGDAFQLHLTPVIGGSPGFDVANLQLQGPVTPHLQYRSGIVFPPGSVPSMQLSACPQTAIYLHGYLTSN